ncbi:MAG: NTP transferase domain-containing protein [Candidatus Aminicenantes bacterium]|nr:NTP transferase domain-containing protein [Candidatus Aminicenantes bacterium]
MRTSLAIILAGPEVAGPGALHPILGRPLLRFALDAVRAIRPAGDVLIVGLPAAAVRAVLGAPARSFAVLEPRPGRPARAGLRLLESRAGCPESTGLAAARRAVRARTEDDVLVLPADLPLLEPATLKTLLRRHRDEGNALTVLTGDEESARAAALAVGRRDLLRAGLKAAAPAEDAGSLDVLVAHFLLRRKRVGAAGPGRSEELLRIRSLPDVARAGAVLRDRKNRELGLRGVEFRDPASTWVDLDAEVGPGTVIFPGVVIEGPCVIGRHTRLEPHVHLRDVRLGDRVRVLSSSLVEGCIVEDDVQIGPFARLRPQTVLRTGSRVGNFVEMKNTDFGPGSKALHLSYLGDSLVERNVNVGAGTITCNYDGLRKNRTRIEEGAFIGSGTQLIAPLRVGRGAYVGAGSTITKDVEPEALAVSRSRQVQKPGWAARRRARKSAAK